MFAGQKAHGPAPRPRGDQGGRETGVSVLEAVSPSVNLPDDLAGRLAAEAAGRGTRGALSWADDGEAGHARTVAARYGAS